MDFDASRPARAGGAGAAVKPPTPAMIQALREIERKHLPVFAVNRRTLLALAERRLVEIPRVEQLPYSRAPCHITDEGRRVLAEHTTGDE